MRAQSVSATEAAVSGLPLVLASAGRAAELVGDRGERGILVANPAADGAGIDEKSIRRARRARQQRNRAELVAALARVHDEIADWRARRADLAATAADLFDEGPMVAAHARVLAAAAASRPGGQARRGG